MLRVFLLAFTLTVSLPVVGNAAGPTTAPNAGDPLNIGFVLYTESGTPGGIVQKIYRDLAEIAADPAFRNRHVLARGFDPVFSTPEVFTNFIQADMRQKAQLIRISGAKAE